MLMYAFFSLAGYRKLTVAEVYARPDSQIGQTAQDLHLPFERMGLHNDYDLSKTSGYNRAKFLVQRDRPRLLVVSSPRGPWSPMQNANQRTAAQRETLRRKQLRSHRIFENSKRLIFQQLEQNGIVLAEQPVSSRVWRLTCWKDLKKTLPYEVVVHGCAVGLNTPDTGELMPKKWKFLTNDQRLWLALQPLKCDGRHGHAAIEVSRRTEQSGHYPPALCRRILRAITSEGNNQNFEKAIQSCHTAVMEPPAHETATLEPPLSGQDDMDISANIQCVSRATFD